MASVVLTPPPPWGIKEPPDNFAIDCTINVPIVAPTMNPTVTTEELLALSKSADLLRQTVEKAMRCDSLARELHQAKLDRDAWEAEANARYTDSRVWRERYDAEVAKNGELLRENETLARNMPPEPPVEGTVFGTPSGAAAALVPDYAQMCRPTGVPRIIGQQWCKTDRATTDLVNFAFKFDMQTHYIVLCNVHHDVQTGALTYYPVGVKDLPLVP